MTSKPEKVKPLHWMQVFPADAIAKGSRLSAAQFGAWVRLTYHYWLERGLPYDDECLARLSGLSDKEWKQNKSRIAAMFGPGWSCPELDALLADGDRMRKAKADAARERWNREKGVNNVTRLYADREGK